MSCGIGHRQGSDLGFLCRLAAVAPIQSLAWELLHATGMAPQKSKKKKSVKYLM